jgi:hypothetical protein
MNESLHIVALDAETFVKLQTVVTELVALFTYQMPKASESRFRSFWLGFSATIESVVECLLN